MDFAQGHYEAFFSTAVDPHDPKIQAAHKHMSFMIPEWLVGNTVLWYGAMLSYRQLYKSARKLLWTCVLMCAVRNHESDVTGCSIWKRWISMEW